MKYLNPVSDTIRSYLERKEVEFTDFEIATLIFKSDFTYLRKKELLSELRDSTEDETLRKQIDERIKVDEEALASITSDENDILFTLYTYYAEFDSYVEKVHFKTYELAKKYGEQIHLDYKIRKTRLISENDIREMSNRYSSPVDLVGEICFNQNHEIIRFISYEAIEDRFFRNTFYLDRFENSYVDFPHPFKAGSIVKNIETGERGIVSLTYPGYTKERNRILGFTDTLILVDYLFKEDYTFESFATNPWLLEYDYNNDDCIQKTLITVNRFYKGELPISELQHQLRELDKYRKE